MSQLNAPDDQKHLYIVDRINIDFILQILIVPKAQNLTKFKISGHLPVLQVLISDKKYKALIKIIDVVVPKLADKQSLPEKITNQPIKEPSLPTYSDLTKQNAFQFTSQKDLVISDESEDGGDDRFEEASDGISDNLSTVQQKNFRIYLQSGQASRPLFLSLILIELGLERELTMLVAEALPTRLPCPAV